jgi:hypothetical protein
VSHPTLLTYGETCSRSFPLILCMGREPNTDQRVEPGIGRYDFDQPSTCGFWNTSYGVVARVVCKSWRTRRMKELCRPRKASPIIYADVLPIGLKYEESDKGTARAAVLPEQAAQHIQSIFFPPAGSTQEAIIRRVRLVLLSGLDRPRFQYAVLRAQEACNRRQIPHISVPFFVGTNTEAIQDALTAQDRAAIQAVCSDFLAH